MNWTALLVALGAALNTGGVATTGALSSVLHVIGAFALYMANSPLKGKTTAPATSETPPTSA